MTAGVKFGRKPKLTPHQAKEAIRRIDAGESQPAVARLFNVNQTIRVSRIIVGLPKTRRIAVTPMQWIARRGTAAVNVVGRIT